MGHEPNHTGSRRVFLLRTAAIPSPVQAEADLLENARHGNAVRQFNRDLRLPGFVHSIEGQRNWFEVVRVRSAWLAKDVGRIVEKNLTFLLGRNAGELHVEGILNVDYESAAPGGNVVCDSIKKIHGESVNIHERGVEVPPESCLSKQEAAEPIGLLLW